MAASPSTFSINAFLIFLCVRLLSEAGTFAFAPLTMAQFGMKESALKAAAALPLVSHLLFPGMAAFQVSLAYLAHLAVRSPLYGVKVLACRVVVLVMLLLLPVNSSMFDFSALGGRAPGAWWDPSNHTMAVITAVMAILPMLPGLHFALQPMDDIMSAGKVKPH